MKFTVKTGETLFEALQAMYPQSSKQSLRKMIQHSEISCNGEPLKLPKDPVKPGDEIVMEVRPEKEIWQVYGRKIEILFRDEDFLIANKPAGILTSGESTAKSPTFHKLLETALNEDEKYRQRLFIVHRLDREVGGLVIFALSDEVKELLKENWSRVQKTYLCLTQNKPAKEEGTIRSWLKDGAKQKVFYYDHEIPDSKYAITHYKFVKTIGKYHLLEVILETGRKNQIRVHMAEMGCPVVGDWKYGADKSVERQIRLLAWKIELNHPVTGDHIKVEAPVTRRFYYPSDKENEKYK